MTHHNAVQMQSFTPVYKQLVVLLAVSGFSLSFIHEVFWALVIGSTFFLIHHSMLKFSKLKVSRKSLYLSIFLLFSLTYTLLWGAINQFYNLIGLIMLFCGLVVGYYASTVKLHSTLAWLPFSIFLGYFIFCWLTGVDTNAILPRNSKNYISIIMLGLFATAVLLSKPAKPTLFIYFAGVAVLSLSIWAEGRSGIISSFLLLLMIVSSSVLGVRIKFRKQLVILVIITIFLCFFVLYNMGTFDRLSERGFTDYSRARIISEYFSGISIPEFLNGRNYESIASLSHYGFNLHNSFLAAWASGGFLYFLFLLITIVTASFRFFLMPMVAVAVIPLSVRAITDTQIFFGKYDYVLIAVAFFILTKKSFGPYFSYIESRSGDSCLTEYECQKNQNIEPIQTRN